MEPGLWPGEPEELPGLSGWDLTGLILQIHTVKSQTDSSGKALTHQSPYLIPFSKTSTQVTNNTPHPDRLLYYQT